MGLEDIPKLDLANLDTLPWTTYRTKELAEPGHTGWIKNPRNFSDFDNPVAADLANALTRSDGKLELGEYVYSLSGKEKQFINRKPIKKTEKSGKDASKPRAHFPYSMYSAMVRWSLGRVLDTLDFSFWVNP